MASTSFNANGYVMAARIPIRDVNPVVPAPTQAQPLRISSRIIGAREECTGSASQCEKPVDQSALTLPITLGVSIPIISALCLLFYFHRRNVKKQRLEDINDPNRGLDFGLGETSSDKDGKGKRKSTMFREKGLGVDTKKRQLSMDMNLSSPYLLPPGLQSSRESLHSLARSLHNNEDPYRPVAAYAGSDVGSIRSFKPDGSSVYTRSTSQKRGSSMTGRTAMTNSSLPPRQNSLPRAPGTPIDPFATPKSRSGSPAPEILSPISPVVATPTSPAIRSPLIAEPIIPQIETVPYPDDRNRASLPQIPDVPEPAPVALKGLPNNPRPFAANPPAPAARGTDTAPSAADVPGAATAEPAQAPSLSAIGLGLDDMSFPTPSHRLSPPAGGSLPSSPRPRKDSAPSTLPAIVPEEVNAYNDRNDQNQDDHDYEYEERGRSQRRSVEIDDYRQSRQLGVPAQDNKRLSVGFRPLPPDEVMESEDPEERANRIRSFYKEYFDPDNPHQGGQQAPPPPSGPPRGPPRGRPQYQYYEDANPGFMGPPGGDAYFDPDTNSFVMPYAQPVTRRAMTPPPNASRFRGPPPPRVMHGSMGGRMASPGPGPRGRGPPPRAGSAMSSRLGPSRRGSDMSSQYTTRPGSSVSNRMGPPRQKPKGPPPADLTTLPNPSKLKDDSFAIMNPLDFAPPETFADRARGRSQSPAGERRPYQPKVPIHSPLVSSFEEMPAMPSPHMLRKSGTFTALDFAPPRKFKDADTMSDAGSIRSNRSGISAVNQAAIRSGAGRVSRLPGDTVFASAALQDQLKPSWGMRP